MIVVAVIGVLAAIAIPQYQNYVKKSALGTALASASAYKIIVEDEIASTGSFPAISEAFGIGTINATSGAVSTNEIVASITEGAGKGQKVKLVRDSNGWECKLVSAAVSITGCS
ncbi:pilin subunit PilA [Vibrio diabolicus E0666]|nr:pilin subunit PilA [Vibrio diabolicus E0666]